MYKFTDKKTRFIAKEYDSKGNFLQSVIIPTDSYPLPAPEYEVFHRDNTEELFDEGLLKIIDSCPYRGALSFANTKELAQVLRDAGVNYVAYMGWKFLRGGGRPLHHAWIVVEGTKLIDLTDDEYVYEVNIGRAIKEQQLDTAGMTADDWRELRVSFMQDTAEWPNSKRCMPLGKVYFPDMLYIGNPCDPLLIPAAPAEAEK